jgi:hypothetical protein
MQAGGQAQAGRQAMGGHAQAEGVSRCGTSLCAVCHGGTAVGGALGRAAAKLADHAVLSYGMQLLCCCCAACAVQGYLCYCFATLQSPSQHKRPCAVHNAAVNPAAATVAWQACWVWCCHCCTGLVLQTLPTFADRTLL